jgi:hypothetical protein
MGDALTVLDNAFKQTLLRKVHQTSQIENSDLGKAPREAEQLGQASLCKA